MSCPCHGHSLKAAYQSWHLDDLLEDLYRQAVSDERAHQSLLIENETNRKLSLLHSESHAKILLFRHQGVAMNLATQGHRPIDQGESKWVNDQATATENKTVLRMCASGIFTGSQPPASYLLIWEPRTGTLKLSCPWSVLKHVRSVTRRLRRRELPLTDGCSGMQHAVTIISVYGSSRFTICVKTR